MDWFAWFTEYKIPVGKWIKGFVDLLNAHAAGFFNALSKSLGFMIQSLIDILQWFSPVVLAVLIAALGYWLHRSWRLALGILLPLLLIINLGYWKETTETLALVIYATLICLALGVPIGIAAAHRPWLFAALRPVLDLMQTIPTFVYLIPTLILFGLGVVPGLISTVIFAIPAPIRLTHLGISSVPKPLLEAGAAFGATSTQLLWKIELPHALPTIMEGLTQTIMLSLSMVVIAALVGANGLGKPVVRALNTVNIAQGFEAGLAIVILAIVLDRMCKQHSAKAH
ncbi:MAG: choline ABC transporter permease subunit [Gammaproteobacteria bacterium]